jgi:hypothetical protein
VCHYDIVCAIDSGDALVDLLSLAEFNELLGRLALRFTPPKENKLKLQGKDGKQVTPSPVRSLQRLFAEMELSGGRQKVRPGMRAATVIPAFKGIHKLVAPSS